MIFKYLSSVGLRLSLSVAVSSPPFSEKSPSTTASFWTASKQQAASSKQQAASSKQRAASSKQQVAGSR